MKTPLTLCAISLMACCVPSAAAEVRYRLTRWNEIAPPGFPAGAYVTAINESGLVLGEAYGCCCGDTRTGFVWYGVGNLRIFNPVPPNPCYPTGIWLNNAGQVAGYESGQTPFFWSPETGSMNLLPPNADFELDLEAFNDLGQIVGYIFNTPNDEVGGPFIWDPVLGLHIIGDFPGAWANGGAADINNAGQVVGSSYSATGYHAFLWTYETGLTMLPEDDSGAIPYEANVINNHGLIAGKLSSYEVFVWDQVGDIQNLGRPPANPPTLAYPVILEISDTGVVLGRYNEGPGDFFYWTWDQQHGFRRLPDVVDPCHTVVAWFGASRIDPNGLIWSDAGLMVPYIPGDLDDDGEVALNDVATMLVNFGTPAAATYADGDLDCDAAVTLSDLAWLLTNFGETLPTP
jgi:probable HAF family extracellular repeat protein